MSEASDRTGAGKPSGVVRSQSDNATCHQLGVDTGQVGLVIPKGLHRGGELDKIDYFILQNLDNRLTKTACEVL